MSARREDLRREIVTSHPTDRRFLTDLLSWESPLQNPSPDRPPVTRRRAVRRRAVTVRKQTRRHIAPDFCLRRAIFFSLSSSLCMHVFFTFAAVTSVWSEPWLVARRGDASLRFTVRANFRLRDDNGQSHRLSLFPPFFQGHCSAGSQPAEPDAKNQRAE